MSRRTTLPWLLLAACLCLLAPSLDAATAGRGFDPFAPDLFAPETLDVQATDVRMAGVCARPLVDAARAGAWTCQTVPLSQPPVWPAPVSAALISPAGPMDHGAASPDPNQPRGPFADPHGSRPIDAVAGARPNAPGPAHTDPFQPLLPASLPLLAGGLGCLALVRRRSRAA
jgi:hypothetical protein